ncbi:MAG TPA: hypothetical protein VGR16_02545, partial [Thermomicrobiales bacterium]|nr:hypothetical protein [Thermomicrobiales bacterium]
MVDLAGPSDRVVHAALIAVGHLRADELWPGFTPASVPVAVFDGEQTLLARFPGMPPPFLRVPGTSDLSVMPGRHPAVTANTAVEIQGVGTAAIMLDHANPPSRDALTALIVHEAFHVFQRAHYPDWGANEAELFMYPHDDARLAALQRLEVTALRRSLTAMHGGESRAWAARVIQTRRERYKTLPEGARAYERETERFEGLASYVEGKLLTNTSLTILSEDQLGVGQVRRRGYATGLAWALLLERMRPRWQQDLDAAPGRYLDELLGQVVAPGREDWPGFSHDERATAMERARQDIAA